MSRIGKEPVKLADGVTVAVAGQLVTVKGKLGELSYTMHEGITAKVEDGNVKVACADDDKFGNFHGLARAPLVAVGHLRCHAVPGLVHAGGIEPERELAGVLPLSHDEAPEQHRKARPSVPGACEQQPVRVRAGDCR